MSETTPHPKLYYFARRNPRFDRAGFIARWRKHAQLGMSMARWRNIERYVHCDVVGGPAAGLPLGAADGIAILWYRSERTRLAHIADRSAGPVMKEDERETFDRPVRDVSVLTKEVVELPHSHTPRKLIARLWRPSELSVADYRAFLLQDWGPRLAERLRSGDFAAGYSQNQARQLSQDQPLLCDSVQEIDALDPAGCAAALRAVVDSAGDRLAAIELNWTEETVLYSLDDA